MLKLDGYTTIEEVKEIYDRLYNSRINLYSKIELKAWLYHSESRVRNNHPPFDLNIYSHTMRALDLLDQVKVDMIDCSDLGGKEAVIEFLEKRINY
jgi:hypothetical protein